MMTIYITILVTGIAIASLIIILGAVTSRLYGVKFFYWSLLSVAIYLGLSFWGTREISPIAGITIVGLVGLYEAIVGLRLVWMFRAKIDQFSEDDDEVLAQNYPPSPTLTLTIVLIYLCIGWVGTVLAHGT